MIRRVVARGRRQPVRLITLSNDPSAQVRRGLNTVAPISPRRGVWYRFGALGRFIPVSLASVRGGDRRERVSRPRLGERTAHERAICAVTVVSVGFPHIVWESYTHHPGCHVASIHLRIVPVAR